MPYLFSSFPCASQQSSERGLLLSVLLLAHFLGQTSLLLALGKLKFFFSFLAVSSLFFVFLAGSFSPFFAKRVPSRQTSSRSQLLLCYINAICIYLSYISFGMTKIRQIEIGVNPPKWMWTKRATRQRTV